jgi:hypothetical protein
MMLENGVTTSADLAFGGFAGEDRGFVVRSLYDLPSDPSQCRHPVAPLVTGDPNEWLTQMQTQYGGTEKFFFFFRTRVKAVPLRTVT